MNVEAQYYTKLDNKKVQCNLCHHTCVISDGNAGICLIRQNIEGKLYQTSYNEVTSLNIDPVEKKPLYHFFPGTEVLSLGTNGCNLKCSFCQNWQISTQITTRKSVTIDELLDISFKNNIKSIAYTYNEPIIWYEFVLDCMKAFRKAGIKNIMVSNGCINPEPLHGIIPYLDAINIDIKGFNSNFYKWVKGNFDLVKQTVETISKTDIHMELTNLIIPTKNDDENEFESMCKWIASLNPNIVLHISRYFPSYKCNIPPTNTDTIANLYEKAKKHLKFVYPGNINIGNNTENTYCPDCSALLIKRSGFNTKTILKDNRCPHCNRVADFIIT